MRDQERIQYTAASLWLGVFCVAFNVFALFSYQQLVSQSDSVISLGVFYQGYLGTHISLILIALLSTPCVAWLAGTFFQQEDVSDTNAWKMLTTRFSNLENSPVSGSMPDVLARSDFDLDFETDNLFNADVVSQFEIDNQEDEIHMSLTELARELANLEASISRNAGSSQIQMTIEEMAERLSDLADKVDNQSDERTG